MIEQLVREETEQQRLGTAFEIILVQTLTRLGYKAEHNYRFCCRGKGERQVDMLYFKPGTHNIVILEAKYRSPMADGKLPVIANKLRDGAVDVRYRVIEPVDTHFLQLHERCLWLNELFGSEFPNKDMAAFVTNAYFDDEVKKEAVKKGYHVFERKWVDYQFHEAGGRGNIDDLVRNFDTSRYINDTTRVWAPWKR
jgi:hypothetical protein